MERDYWFKQTKEKPLFPDLLWSRPENKRHAGKLLIIGGNKYGFAAAAEAYQASDIAGVGLSKVLLPDALRKTVGIHLEAAEFTATTPSGSFSREALADFLELASWADGVLLAGDLGRNSETAILLESFFMKYSGLITLTKDALDYVTGNAAIILKRENTTLVLSMAQLQKLAKAAGTPRPVTFSMDFLQLIDFLHEFTLGYAPHIVVKHLDTIFVAVNGQVSTTKLDKDLPVWRVKTAAAGVVWQIQQPQKPFEALTISIVSS